MRVDPPPATNCQLCGSPTVRELADFGPRPICHRYLRRADDPEYTHPLVVGQCEACGLVQLQRPVPSEELIPPFEWIQYTEPEGHLDAMCDLLAGLPGIMPRSVLSGLTFKDDTLLRRFRERGFRYTWRLDPARELDLEGDHASVETTQDHITRASAVRVTHRRGRSDMFIARQVLEHAHAMREFLDGLKQLIYPGGYVVIEVPDCARALDSCDVATLWEHHTAYFTPETLQHGLQTAGFRLVRFQIFPYPFENSLVAVLQLDGGTQPVFPPAAILEKERRRARAFVDGLAEQKRRVADFLNTYRRRGGKVALFGAGHLACTFINLLGLSELVDFLIDDHPRKKGLLMPGSHLPVVGPEKLMSEPVALCLLSLSPESEDVVIARNADFVKKGGVFSSINPASRHALKI